MYRNRQNSTECGGKVAEELQKRYGNLQLQGCLGGEPHCRNFEKVKMSVGCHRKQRMLRYANFRDRSLVVHGGIQR